MMNKITPHVNIIGGKIEHSQFVPTNEDLLKVTKFLSYEIMR